MTLRTRDCRLPQGRARSVDCYSVVILSATPPSRSFSWTFFIVVVLALTFTSSKVVVCVRRLLEGKVKQEVRTFRTQTNALLDMGAWLAEMQVTHLARESTGVYWKPIWNLLEGVFEMMLVNAEHIKKVPGRKTVVKDAQWIAEVLQHGLLKPSFVPEKPVRQLRDLTRQRV